jgi:hypothetical protein
MAFTIGADPEFFIKQHNKHKSAIGLIGGSKAVPRPLARDGFAILEDNVAVEFNIAPCHNHMEFIEAIQYVMEGLKKNVLPEYEVSTESAVLFEQDQLNHPQAMEFGCEPDYNAWTKDINPRPCAADAALRSAGGHVHVGTTENPIEVIRAMDLFLGVPSTKMDKGTLRRQLYGKAGSFRQKDYGCEYRTLSNFWIFSPDLIKWVYEQTEKAISFVANGNKVSDEDGHLIQACINNNSGEAYEYLSKAHGLG